MQINPFEAPKERARQEAYAYFDEHIRPLPKRRDGSLDLLKPGFDDNDVDAFRHAYVSGMFTQQYGERTANILGLMNEYSPEGQYSHSVSPGSRNMDLWNNRVGRKYGRKTRSPKRLLKLIHDALLRGELITDPKDSREFSGPAKVALSWLHREADPRRRDSGVEARSPKVK